jgi:hypothetical protein
MGHFAKVENGIVTKVIVADSEFFETFIDNTPGKWIQTSYNTRGGFIMIQIQICLVRINQKH